MIPAWSLNDWDNDRGPMRKKTTGLKRFWGKGSLWQIIRWKKKGTS